MTDRCELEGPNKSQHRSEPDSKASPLMMGFMSFAGDEECATSGAEV